MAHGRQTDDNKCRVEYDAYRVDIELRQQPTPEVQQRFEQHKQKFECLRQVLDVKLKFVDENKVRALFECTQIVN